MKNMFKTAVQWRLLETNPVDGVNAPRTEERQLVIPSAEEIHSTFDALQSTRHYLAFKLLLHSGSEWGEIHILQVRRPLPTPFRS